MKSPCPKVGILLCVATFWTLAQISSASVVFTSIYGYSINKYDFTTGAYLGSINTGSDIPEGLAFDSAGNLYAAFADSSTIKKIAPDGTMTLIASNLNGPRGIAFDSNGELVVACWNDGAVRKVTLDGNVSIFASGMGQLWGLAVDKLGNTYCTSPGSAKLYKIDGAGNVSILRSSFYPFGLGTDADNNVYLADDYTTVVKITPGGTVSTYATGGPYPGAGFFRPSDLLFSDSGNLLIASDGSGIYQADAPGPATLLASTAGTPLFLAINPVPEPSTMTFVLISLAMLVGMKRHRGNG
jgi:hypothetical protein